MTDRDDRRYPNAETAMNIRITLLILKPSKAPN